MLTGNSRLALEVIELTPALEVVEMTRVNLQMNALSFKGLANIPLAAGSVIKVGNLLHRTADNFPSCIKKGPPNAPTSIGTIPATVTHTLPPLTVTFPASDGFTEMTSTSTVNTVTLSQVDCVMVASEIRFPLARGVAPGRPLVFHFSVMNSAGATAGAVPHVAIAGCRASLSVFEKVGCAHNPSAGAAACLGCTTANEGVRCSLLYP
ncbi:hypothetical protein T484DRAFT_1828992 [Baffinella frigidus]|nr:hypothetical protein T484DRAFT_1828992 [Cryptophyta sp. CCMP2293]